MKRVISLVAVAVMLGVFSLNSCTSGYAQPTSTGTINKNLIGVWKWSEGGSSPFNHIVFFDNGAYLGGSSEAGRYSIYNDVLMTSRNGNAGEYGSLYTFSISGGTLTLIGYGDSEGNKATFKKVK